jgi:hypothetical protein
MVAQDLEVVVEGTTCTISEGDLTNGDLEMQESLEYMTLMI